MNTITATSERPTANATGLFAVAGGVLAANGSGAPTASRSAHARTCAGVGLSVRSWWVLALGLLCLMTYVSPATAAGLSPALAAGSGGASGLITPALSLPSEFGYQGQGAGEFEEPHGIAVAQQTGDIYFADRNNNRLDSFGPEGVFRFAVGWGVRDGKNELEVCNAACRAGVSGAGAGQFFGPTGTAIDNNPASESFGDVYVLDGNYHRVQKFDSEGHFLLMFGKGVNLATKGDVCTAAESENCGEGQFGFEPGELSIAEGLAVDGAGNVYVGDFNRIEKFTSEGTFTQQWSVSEGFSLVPSLAVNASNEIYAIVEGSGIHRYDQAGNELGTPFDTTGSPTKLTLGPSGEVYLNEGDENFQQAHLFEYSPSGAELAAFDVGTEEGFRGIAFSDTAERVYVLNSDKVRLVAVPPAGPYVAPGSETIVAAKPTHVEVQAVLDAEGSPTTYHFQYGETTSYGSTTPLAQLPEENGLFAAVSITGELTGLKPDTPYHFRVVAEDEHGHLTLGPDTTLTTPTAVLLTGESAAQVTSESAQLSVEINPQGAPTHYHFEYGPTSSYGQGTPVPDANAGEAETTTTHNILIEHLQPTTTYHYRVVASNELGTIEGPDHTFTTTAASGSRQALIDGRSWEMVSPPQKHGAQLQPISEEGGLIEASETGDALAYIGLFSLGSEAEPEGNQNISDSQFVATRSAPGVWQTKDITTPHEQPAGFHPGKRAEYLFFSGDLSKALAEPFGATRLSPQATERTPYLRDDINGGYTPLVTEHNTPSGTKFGGEETRGGDYVGGLELVGASADLSSAVIGSPLALTSDFSSSEAEGRQSLYRWNSEAGTLQLVSWLPPSGETPQGTPAALAGDYSHLGRDDVVTRHAVSVDGSRLVFETENPTTQSPHLFMRDTRLGKTVQLDLREDGTPAVGRARFQDASEDGRVVFFTDPVHLTANATGNDNHNHSDLYRCEIQEVAGGLRCSLKLITNPINAGETSDVLNNIVGADANGDRVYFVANGRLTPDAAHGNCSKIAAASLAEASVSCNLYVYDQTKEEVRLVAVLSGRDFPDWGSKASDNLKSLTARVSPNGRYLVFMSQRSLTGYDNRDARSGVPDEEVFRYDFDRSQLVCVSCERSGARPNGILDTGFYPGLLIDHPKIWSGQWVAAMVPGWTGVSESGPPVRSEYQSRYLTDDGRVFFDSVDGLVPADVNGQPDVYEYEPGGVGSCDLESGCVGLLSSGVDAGESAFLDSGGEGENVFFLTKAKLSSQDTDSLNDVYDAHVCGVASQCPPVQGGAPPPCETSDACRAAPSPQPDTFGAPASATFSGAGNVQPAIARATKPVARKARRLASALQACRKDRARRSRVACERRARKRYGPSRGQRTRRLTRPVTRKGGK